ncbi:MAG: UvrD-helicase domain-containing protein [Parachlamydiales bacterium]|jgi:DNA helicase-2/ATP-dependent DNA helicase PcrA
MKTLLNPAQKKAVEHGEGPLLVLAGAGSGKTRVVTERILHLLSLGLSTEEILAVTFTNRAAKEMQERVRQRAPESPLICTFHSLGAKILRESIHHLGYLNNFLIYDEEDSLKLIKNALKKLSLDEKLAKELRSKISGFKNSLASPEFLKELEKQNQKHLFETLFGLYQNQLKENNALDFDDLIYLPVQLFQEHQNLRQEYQNRFSFLLIDEYQDTNQAQYLLAKNLASSRRNIFAVGDPDQSIYSWRGACYQNILNFEKDFPGAKTIALEQNYRSTNLILKAANALILNNEKRFHKNLFSDLGQGEKIGLFFADSDQDEASFVVEKIQALCQSQSLDAFGVFYRTNAQSRLFEDLLLAAKIPYRIYGGVSFYQRKEIKDISAYLKLLVSENDALAFERTVNLPRRGLGKATLNKLIGSAEKNQKPVLTFLQQLIEKELDPKDPSLLFSSKQKAAFRQYLELIFTFRQKMAAAPLADLIRELVQASGYLNHLKEDPPSFEERKENLDELISKAAEYQENCPQASLAQFLDEIALLSPLENTAEPGPEGCLKLMSLHSSKGLEFTTVFITGLEEGLLPHLNAQEDASALEEERRLFYVGITRAKKKLFLSLAAFRRLFGHLHFSPPSRFLQEIPEACLEKLSCFGSEKSSFKIIPAKNLAQETFTDEGPFQVGDKVFHRTFGKGQILKAASSSFGPTYEVLFENESSSRTLAAKYAHLSRYLDFE